MATSCTHLDQVHHVEPRTPDGCEECLQTGDRWVHLRLCLTCGHVGCCDSSPNRHASKHHHATQHPIVQSFEPNEDWSWCYPDQVVLEPAEIEAARRHASSDSGDGEAQTGPAGRPGGLLRRVINLPYRNNYVVGVLDDDAAARSTAEDLRTNGFSEDEVVIQSGDEISNRLRREDLGNLVRIATTEEGTICRDYDERSRGGTILSAYTSSRDRVDLAARIMAEHGAHSLKHFGNWTITEVAP